jgi:hypothetical protein
VSEARGPADLPPASQMLGRVFKVFGRVGLLMVVIVIVWAVSGALSSFTLRVIVGLGLAGGVAALLVNYFRQVGHPPPPDPEPTSVHPGLRLAYVCGMCGLELAVVKVAKDRAPKHCGEAMELVRRPAPGGADPGAERGGEDE